MILTFSGYGKGKGHGPVAYVCDSIKHDGTQRSVAPEILKGSRATTKALIDKNENKYKYTSAVISFTKEEFSKELALKVLKDFIDCAFVGLNPAQYDLLAVLHLDTEHPHIHLVIPRVELTTGKDFNIAPPPPRPNSGKQAPTGSVAPVWRDWSTLTRHKHGLAPVEASEDLDRLPLTQKERRALSKVELSKLPHTQAKLALDGFVKDNIANGLIRTKKDIVQFLKEQGFEVCRITSNSISVNHNNKNIRLSGGIYEDRTDRKTFTDLAFEQARERGSGNTFGPIEQKPKINRRENFDNASSELGRIKQRYQVQISKIHNRNIARYRGGNSQSGEVHSSVFSQAGAPRQAVVRSPTDKQPVSSHNVSNRALQNKPTIKAVSSGGKGDDRSQIAELLARLGQTSDPFQRLELEAQIFDITRKVPNL
ncbi:relaxase/mobilization nuclease domain-containing protein [Variovorax sp. E3]|uniref:relaxase/mobilization nuclease domain-containing protein n=1 Tax=Variovorax sp. E3 TaxID=1914993 RepID=UPI0018DB1333|nr:relaxase/mobilization nuclease domain-containing protein [Variovorax sp. E3]